MPRNARLLCIILGLSLKTRPDRLVGGGTRTDPRILFSGFWCQGDGACFEAHYSYAKGCAQKIRTHAPLDKELHRIADALQQAQRRNFYQLTAETTHRGHYYHEYCMSVSVDRDSPTYQDIAGDSDGVVIETLRDLARWLYRQLQQEYEDQTSDDAVDEMIIANGYTFTETGRRFG